MEIKHRAPDKGCLLVITNWFWFILYKDCARKRFASKWFRYEYI